MMKPNAVKDEERVAIAAQYGYSVIIDKEGSQGIDSAMPRFHKYGSDDACRVESVDIVIPSAHAVRFAIPCARCFPKTT